MNNQKSIFYESACEGNKLANSSFIRLQKKTAVLACLEYPCQLMKLKVFHVSGLNFGQIESI